MGIKGLTKTITKYSPESITHENLYKLSGKKVAVDASLILYQQLLKSPGKIFKNSKGQITSHITGVFYKFMNYISLSIDIIFIFDGKPPVNKQECINQRKEKSKKAKEAALNSTCEEEKEKLEKSSLRLTKEMIDDVKKLLTLMGIAYIHPEVGEGEGYASELCRMGYVDYVLTEDMDTMAYGCPKLIRNCIDKSIRRKDIVSIFDYSKLMSDIELTHEQFLDFCILCGCDYCPIVPKIGNVTAMKLIKKHNCIETIIDETSEKYEFPENYLTIFNEAKLNFKVFMGKLTLDDININIKTGQRDIEGLSSFLINDIEMNEKRVQNSLKKFHNNYNASK
jgi:flap endonuclease-1|tara:strand:+ start:1567 stop:2580 length:1014 start_codon:yes stop_codon:yes gene_type:complete